MIFDSSYYLKWIEAHHPAAHGIDFKAVQLCVLAAVDANKVFYGITVFEPRSLDQAFFEKLSLRQKKTQDSSFILYLPESRYFRFEF